MTTTSPATTGRHCASKAARQRVVCGWPPDRHGLDPAIALGALRRLAPDGTLVVFGVPGQDGLDSGTAVRAATAAKLAYLQHIVAVYAPTRGGTYRARQPDGLGRRRGCPPPAGAHRRARLPPAPGFRQRGRDVREP